MFFIQSSKQADGSWKPIQKDQYSMTVSKLCNRLSARAGIRSEYTYALKKHGSVIFDKAGQAIKFEIQLEEKDGKHEFTGATADFSRAAQADSHASCEHSPGESCEVHSGRGSVAADGRSGDADPSTQDVPAAGEVQSAAR